HPGPKEPALRKARICYDHLAVDYGVRMTDSRIDAFITCAFLLKQLRPAETNDFDGPNEYLPSSIKSEHGFLMARPFTNDVNHAIDLCREV
ncbi:hypothetical protein ACC780_37810, partial [Rhizobium ruizarguesonis]